MSQSRSWLFTLNATTYPQDVVEQKLASYTYIAQLETGEKTGYEHWQGYIENKNPIKFSTLKNSFPTGHFERRRGTRQEAYDYCMKVETSQGIRIGNGEIDLTDEQGKRTDIEILREALLIQNKSVSEIILTMPQAARHIPYLERLDAERKASAYSKNIERARTENRNIQAHYLWGETSVGKSWMLREKYGADAYWASGTNMGFDGYSGEPVLILDEFRSQIHISEMLKILDPYPYRVKARYQDKIAAWEEVWVVSNIPLDEQYQSKDIDPFTKDAFRARFTRSGSIQRMLKGGVLVDDSSAVETAA